MFKKLLSALTVMLFLCGVNAGAQELQKANLGKVMPKFVYKTEMASIIDLGQSEFWTGYWDGVVNENTKVVGVNQTPMKYTCAIAYPAGSAEVLGMTIEGVKFVFADHKNIANVKVFMSTHPVGSASEADICVDDVKDIVSMQSSEKDFMNEVRFSKPYKVDPAKDLYIGYSFDVTGGTGDFDNFPVCIQAGADKKNSFLLGFDGQPIQDFYGQGFGVLAMQVLMSGEFEDNAVTITSDLGTITGSKGSFDLPVSVQNAGNKGIESLTIDVDVAGVKTTCEIKADKKIEGIGTKFDFIAKINTPEEQGNFDYTVKVTKVNGVEVTKDVIGKGKMILISRIVEHKALVEEFTGMWCGWCPRGMVALEKIHQEYGNGVITIAAHSGDALECKDYGTVIKALTGGSFPMAAIDRTILGADPYYGTVKADFGIAKNIDTQKAVAPIAEVIAKPVLDGDVLTAIADVRFLYSGDATKYNVGYVLTHDGMQNERWNQKNYYSGMEKQPDPLFDKWTSGKETVKGVVFGEVAIAAKGIEYGIDGSIPATVEADVPVSHSVEFDLTKYKKIQDRNKMNLIVILFDATTGQVVNADIKNINDMTGIEGVETENENVEEVARYTVNGQRINGAQKGINIVKYSNGTVKKVVVK